VKSGQTSILPNRAGFIAAQEAISPVRRRG
jgi:hypothetical protein